MNISYTKSESHNPNSQQADYVGANGVCSTQPGLTKSDSVVGTQEISSKKKSANIQCQINPEKLRVVAEDGKAAQR